MVVKAFIDVVQARGLSCVFTNLQAQNGLCLGVPAMGTNRPDVCDDVFILL
jgi:hypothetical protein